MAILYGSPIIYWTRELLNLFPTWGPCTAMKICPGSQNFSHCKAERIELWFWAQRPWVQILAPPPPGFTKEHCRLASRVPALCAEGPCSVALALLCCFGSVVPGVRCWAGRWPAAVRSELEGKGVAVHWVWDLPEELKWRRPAEPKDGEAQPAEWPWRQNVGGGWGRRHSQGAQASTELLLSQSVAKPPSPAQWPPIASL